MHKISINIYEQVSEIYNQLVDLRIGHDLGGDLITPYVGLYICQSGCACNRLTSTLRFPDIFIGLSALKI
jgi:hypothetical protein